MTDTTLPKPALGVGGLISSSFSLVFGNLVPMMTLGGIPALIGVVLALLAYGTEQQNVFLALTNPDVYAATVQPVSPVVQILVTLVGLVLWGLALAAMTVAAYRAMTGHKVDPGQAFSVALTRLVPVIVCMVVAGIAAYLGLFLLILPGLYLMALWFVIIPAIVVEERFFDSLGRSAALTKEYRWPLVGLVVLFFIVMLLLTIVSAGAQGIGYSMGTVGLILANAIAVVVTAFIYALSGALGALTYARLVEIKEGTGLNSIADVFS